MNTGVINSACINMLVAHVASIDTLVAHVASINTLATHLMCTHTVVTRVSCVTTVVFHFKPPRSPTEYPDAPRNTPGGGRITGENP